MPKVEDNIVPNSQNLDTSPDSTLEDVPIESPYVETLSSKAENQESVAIANKPEKKKPKYLPFLIIIPLLLLLLALGAAYWQINRMAKENGDEISEEGEKMPVEGDGSEEVETPGDAIEDVDLNLNEISDSLREIDDAIYDIDATFQLIDGNLAKNDDTPQL